MYRKFRLVRRRYTVLDAILSTKNIHSRTNVSIYREILRNFYMTAQEYTDLRRILGINNYE